MIREFYIFDLPGYESCFPVSVYRNCRAYVHLSEHNLFYSEPMLVALYFNK